MRRARPRIPLVDLTHRITKGTTPTSLGGQFTDDGINFFKVESIAEDGSLVSDKLAFIDDDSYNRLGRSQLQANDVLFSIAGAIGRTYLVRVEDLPANTNQALAIVRFDQSLVFPAYGYYAMRHRCFQGDAQGRVVQTAQANVNLKQLANSRIPLPNIKGQKRIAFILSAYDDLIENNRRRIVLLEQAARMLYREWFVHLRFPGSAFYSTSSGGTPSRKVPDFFTGCIPWVKTQELTCIFVLSTQEKITDEAIKRSSARLFPRHTVLIAMYGATIGQTAVLSIPAATNQACCAILPKAPGTSFVHASLFFSHHKKDLVALGQGAAQNNISQQVIKSFKMVLPSEGILDLFSETVSPFFDQIETMEKINIQLAKARDLLLPRLMSGEVLV